MSGQVYTLEFQNNSTNAGDVCVYQTPPDVNTPGVMSLAWFSQFNYPTTEVVFKWTIDYSFVWSQTGVLKPGVIFDASQTWEADLHTSNQVTFHYDQAYTFQGQKAGPQAGNLYITEDPTIPLKTASVGIGMSGAGVFAVQAQPNINLVFTPHPLYWITFGKFVPGQVLDIQSLTGVAQVQFPPNIYKMAAILNEDNTWTIEPLK